MNNCFLCVCINPLTFSWILKVVPQKDAMMVPAKNKKKKNQNTLVLSKDYSWIHKKVLHNLNTCLCWLYRCLMGVSLHLEPAAFSVKTTPRTRSPKVTKDPLPPMNLTLQVIFTFQSHTLVFSYSLCLPFFSIISYPILSYLGMHHFFWLLQVFSVIPSLTFSFFLCLS